MSFQYKRRSEEDIEQRAKQQGGSFEGYLLDEYKSFSPKKGESHIRILPRHAREEAKHYGEEVWVHFNIGPERASVLCPWKMAEQPCPICEAKVATERAGDKDAADKLAPKKRVIMLVVDLKEPDKGVLVWGPSWTLDKDIAKASRDRETGKFRHIDDPEQGYGVYFEREGENLHTKYSNFGLDNRPSPVDSKWLDYVEKNPLIETLRYRTYDEIETLFTGGASLKDERKSDDRASLRREPEPAREERRQEPDRGSQDAVAEVAPWRNQPAAESAREAPAAPTSPPPPPPQVEVQENVSGKSRAEMLKEKFANRNKKS